MLFGVGIDIENHHRFLKYKKSELEYLLSIFSQNELNNYAKYNSHLCYAISFCCKESLFKAFGVSWNNSKIQWTDIELLFSDIPETKKASIFLSGFAEELMINNNIIHPPKFDYTITESQIIFESILSCNTK